MVFDPAGRSSTSSSSPPPPLLEDHPPSYDFATVAYPLRTNSTSNVIYHTGTSSSSSRSAPPATPARPLTGDYLCSGPPNAEALNAGNVGLELEYIGVKEIQGEQVGSRQKVLRLESKDGRLANRRSPPNRLEFRMVRWRRQLTFVATVLYDFLLFQALRPPKVVIHCVGAHSEPAEAHIRRDENGTEATRNSDGTQRVVDFDFHIDVTSVLSHETNKANIHIATLPPWVPAHRATHTKCYAATYRSSPYQSLRGDGYQSLSLQESELGIQAGATVQWMEAFRDKKWEAWRKAKGYPVWIKKEECKEWLEESNGKGRAALPTTNVNAERSYRASPGGSNNAIQSDELHDSDLYDVDNEERGHIVPSTAWHIPDLKEWCEAYCGDSGLLKSFTMRREVWGWDREGLVKAIRAAILSTGYESNELTIEFEVDEEEILIRPNNWLSNMMNHQFARIVLWITLLYPVIWLLNRFGITRGAPYDIARASYGLKYYPPLPSTYASETPQSAQERLPGLYKLHPEIPRNTPLRSGPKGVHYLIGRKEGEWFREWEERVRMAVRMKFKGELHGARVDDGRPPSLDGYEENWRTIGDQ